jgi:hypothetical protein
MTVWHGRRRGLCMFSRGMSLVWRGFVRYAYLWGCCAGLFLCCGWGWAKKNLQQSEPGQNLAQVVWMYANNGFVDPA